MHRRRSTAAAGTNLLLGSATFEATRRLSASPSRRSSASPSRRPSASPSRRSSALPSRSPAPSRLSTSRRQSDVKRKHEELKKEEKLLNAAYEKTRAQARSIGVSLIQMLAGGLSDLHPAFEEYPMGMPAYAFIDYVVRLLGSQQTSGTLVEDEDRQHLGEDEYLEAIKLQDTSNQLKAAALRRTNENQKDSDGAELPLLPKQHRNVIPHEMQMKIKAFEGDIAMKMDRWLQHSRHQSLPQVDLFSDPLLLDFGLWELFKAVDHKSRGVITWNDFLAYLIDATMKGRVVSQADEEFKRYTLVSSKINPYLYRMQRIIHVPQLKGYLVLTRGKETLGKEGKKEGQMLRVMEAGTLQQRKVLPLHDEGGQVVTFTYLACWGNFVVLSYSDGKVRFMDSMHQLRMVGPGPCNCTSKARCPHTTGTCSMTLLKWSPRKSRLLLGSRDGHLTQWNVSLLERLLMPGTPPHEPTVEWRIRPHTSAVMDMVFLTTDEQLAASCSLDASVVITNLELRTVCKRFEGHKAAVTCLAYNRQFNFLLSAGVEFDPLCWVVNVPNSRPFPLRDGRYPHIHSIVTLITIPFTCQVVSMDVKGMIKIWDLRVMRCVQTLSCEAGASQAEMGSLHWRALVYNSETKQLVTSAKRKAYVFQYNVMSRNADPDSASDYGIAAAAYISYSKLFITASRSTITLWSLATGTPVRQFNDVTREDITAMCVDVKNNRTYVGAHNGVVVSLLLDTGQPLRKWRHPQDCEISSLTFISSANVVVAVAEGGTTFVLDPTKTDRAMVGHPLTRGNDGRVDAKCVAYDEYHNLVHVGQESNSVLVFKLEDRALTSITQCCNKPAGPEVTAITCLPPHSAFVCADSSGGLHAWSVELSPVISRRLLARWVTYHPKSNLYTPTVTRLEYLVDHQLLYAGDDTGIVNVYSLRETLDFPDRKVSFGDVLMQVGNPRLSVVPSGDDRSRRPTCETFVTQMKDTAVDVPPAGLLTTHSISFSRVLPPPLLKVEVTSSNMSEPHRVSLACSTPRMHSRLTKPALVTRWMAHPSGITALQLLGKDGCTAPLCVMTSGTDCNVLIWSTAGKKISCLAKETSEGRRSQWAWDTRVLSRDRQVMNDIPKPWNPDGPDTVAVPSVDAPEHGDAKDEEVLADFYSKLCSGEVTTGESVPSSQPPEAEDEEECRKRAWQEDLERSLQALNTKLRQVNSAIEPIDPHAMAAQMVEGDKLYNYGLLLRRHNPLNPLLGGLSRRKDLQLMYSLAHDLPLPKECLEPESLKSPRKAKRTLVPRPEKPFLDLDQLLPDVDHRPADCPVFISCLEKGARNVPEIVYKDSATFRRFLLTAASKARLPSPPAEAKGRKKGASHKAEKREGLEGADADTSARIGSATYAADSSRDLAAKSKIHRLPPVHYRRIFTKFANAGKDEAEDDGVMQIVGPPAGQPVMRSPSQEITGSLPHPSTLTRRTISNTRPSLLRRGPLPRSNAAGDTQRLEVCVSSLGGAAVPTPHPLHPSPTELP